ncbi:hypothetical protein [Campylobacter concisus]|nr:hypothetical protein [Campylobacter concisus]ERJ28712.1 hypothetical protein ATCC51561_1919 [Campylobacter concisus ATCC 51561]
MLLYKSKAKFKNPKEPNYGIWQQYFVIDLNVVQLKFAQTIDT